MTPHQLHKESINELIIAYQNKARCYHSENQSVGIYRELECRLGKLALYDLRLAKWHMDNGEGFDEFDNAINDLLKII